MISYKVGNLLDADETLIVHGCNSRGVMGSGVAWAVRNKWPHVFQHYKDQYDREGLSLGECQFIPVNRHPVQFVANAITQKDYGKEQRKYVSYDAIRQCMVKVNHFIDSFDIARHVDNPTVPLTVAMPKIGAGLGGGSWSIIESILAETLKRCDVIVYVLDESEIPVNARKVNS